MVIIVNTVTPTTEIITYEKPLSVFCHSPHHIIFLRPCCMMIQTLKVCVSITELDLLKEIKVTQYSLVEGLNVASFDFSNI